MYTDQELEAMLADLESDSSERKESFAGEAPIKVREAVCAFTNDLPDHRRAGVVFIGARDDGSPAGLAITDELLLQLADIKTDGNIVPPPTLAVAKRRLNGADMAIIEVEPADSPPVRFKGRIWIRIGPRRATASAQDERILNEKRRHRDRPFDVQPVRSASNDVLARMPDLVSAFWWRDLAFKGLGRNEEALADLTRVIELTPEFVDAYSERGELLEQAGRRQEAIDDYSRCIEAEPHDPSRRGRRHHLLRQEKRFEEALADIEAILAQDASHALNHHLQAVCLLNLERWEAAVAAETRAIQRDNTVAEFYLFRAMAQLELRQFEVALKDCLEASERDAEDERITKLFIRIAAVVREEPEDGTDGRIAHRKAPSRPITTTGCPGSRGACLRLRKQAIPVGDDLKVRNRRAALGGLNDQGPAVGGNRVVTGDRIGLAKGLTIDNGGLPVTLPDATFTDTSPWGATR